MTLYPVKAVIAPYLLQIQYESDDGTVGKLFEDQRITHECYLVSIKPFAGHGCSEGPTSTKRPRMEDSTLAEALIIYMMPTEDLKQPHPEPSSDVES